MKNQNTTETSVLESAFNRAYDAVVSDLEELGVTTVNLAAEATIAATGTAVLVGNVSVASLQVYNVGTKWVNRESSVKLNALTARLAKPSRLSFDAAYQEAYSV